MVTQVRWLAFTFSVPPAVICSRGNSHHLPDSPVIMSIAPLPPPPPFYLLVRIIDNTVITTHTVRIERLLLTHYRHLFFKPAVIIYTPILCFWLIPENWVVFQLITAQVCGMRLKMNAPIYDVLQSYLIPVFVGNYKYIWSRSYYIAWPLDRMSKRQLRQVFICLSCLHLCLQRLADAWLFTVLLFSLCFRLLNI